MSRDSIVIVGPTASGKSAVAIEVARRVSGEIISLDSRQIYRGMNIGTAKPTPAEQGDVPHHGFDLINPDERFNAGRFASLAEEWLRAVRLRGHVAVLAGGTGFFLRALTHPMFTEPPADPLVREGWKRYLQDVGTDTLARWAGVLDPHHRAQAVDRQRLSRIIEQVMLTGRPLTWWQQHAPVPPPAIDPLVFVLDLPRDRLVERIDRRVDLMLEAGLAGEVRDLVDAGYSERDPGFKTTGYIEMMPQLRGECTLAEAADQIRATTRQYARRQMTWLRHQLPSDAIWLDGTAEPAHSADIIALRWLTEQSGHAARDTRDEETS